MLTLRKVRLKKKLLCKHTHVILTVFGNVLSFIIYLSAHFFVHLSPLVRYKVYFGGNESIRHKQKYETISYTYKRVLRKCRSSAETN